MATVAAVAGVKAVTTARATAAGVKVVAAVGAAAGVKVVVAAAVAAGVRAAKAVTTGTPSLRSALILVSDKRTQPVRWNDLMFGLVL